MIVNPSRSGHNDQGGQSQATKMNRACLNCRKQKMKCELNDAPPCTRCRKAKTACLFKVRANGIEAGDWNVTTSPPLPSASTNDAFRADVLRRLQIIEQKLGLASISFPDDMLRDIVSSPPTIIHGPGTASATDEDEQYVAGLPDVWAALQTLVALSSDKHNEGWSPRVIEALWLAFAENMPALHLSTQRIFYDRPTPLLLASVLYAAAMQHPLAEYAQLSGFYRQAAIYAIAELVKPQESPARYNDMEDLHNVLGIIITGLMSEAWVSETGAWIAIAYHLILNASATALRVEAKVKPEEWRGVYEGLRVVDIEHASLRMGCPLLPLKLSLPIFQRPTLPDPREAWTHLTTIMHIGLSHFSGRAFPTILDTVLNRQPEATRHARAELSLEDSRMIRDWAKELDTWLIKYHRPLPGQQRGPNEANVISLQYQLHKLFVLSIYYSVRGISMDSNKTSHEATEVLAAARSALKIQRKGMGIWSNWDLVIISLAALIVLDCPPDHAETSQDRLLVQGHINALRNTHQSPPSLRHALSTRLEERIAQSAPIINQPSTTTGHISPNFFELFTHDGGETSQLEAGSAAFPPFFMDAQAIQAVDLSTQHVDYNGMSAMEEITPWWTGGGSETGDMAWPSAFQRVLDSMAVDHDIGSGR